MFQMAIIGQRNALGDITKRQNLPKKAASKGASAKVYLSPSETTPRFSFGF